MSVKADNKKIRRGQSKCKQLFKNFKIYYVNCRELKTKLDSIDRIVNELSPQVICLTETMLGEKEKLSIAGYTPFFNNNKSGKGGIMIAVQNSLKDVTIETDKTLEEYQTLWVKIDNRNNKINNGCVYAPQEKETKF